ncbi:DNA alkylation repair protein, partial [Actinomadura sp. 7K534]|uniref:DNA alkylation repair protein n=1 Tax=Actinomadura sp. 7K534 TaxID=2530366 RepID=UPI00105242B9
ELRGLGESERAVNERRYLKSDFVHFGVPVPAVRKAAVSAVRGELARGEVIALAEGLWSVTEDGRPVHEARVAAIEVLVKRVALLEPGDLVVTERFVRDSASWVYVDNLAEKVVGKLVIRYPEQGTVLDAWVGDTYMWIRRTAMLALLAGVRVGEPDLARIGRFGDALIGEREFFIRKALGWVLRELSKKNAAWVTGWVEARVGVISGVTIREAVRHLPEEDAGRLLAAQRR